MPIALICTTELIDLEMQIVVDAETNLYLKHGFIVKRIIFPEAGKRMAFGDHTLGARIMENADSIIAQMQRMFDAAPPLQAPLTRGITLHGDRIVLIGHGGKTFTEFSAGIIAYLCGLISRLNQTHPIHIIYMVCFGRGDTGKKKELPNSAIGTIATLLHQFYTARQMPIPNITVKGYNCAISAHPDAPRVRDDSEITFSAKSTRARIRYDGVRFEKIGPEDSESEVEALFPRAPSPTSTETAVTPRLQVVGPVPAARPHMISEAEAREAYRTLSRSFLFGSTPSRYRTLHGAAIVITAEARDRPDISCYITEQYIDNAIVRRRHPVHAIDEAGIRAELDTYIQQRERERWE